MILPDNILIEKWTGVPAQCQPPRDFVLFICALALGFLYLKLQPLSRWDPRHFPSFKRPAPNPARQHLGSPSGPRFTFHQRCRWGENGCTVYGWPSSGGVIIRDCADLTELKFLSFDPVNPPLTRLEDPEEEDAFCLELKKIGGKSWSSQHRRLRLHSLKDEPTKDELKEVFIGWPEGGGVLVAEYEDEGWVPDEIGKLRMMTTMEGRCQLLREAFGAKFYKEPGMYGGLAFLGPPRSEAKLG